MEAASRPTSRSASGSDVAPTPVRVAGMAREGRVETLAEEVHALQARVARLEELASPDALGMWFADAQCSGARSGEKVMQEKVVMNTAAFPAVSSDTGGNGGSSAAGEERAELEEEAMDAAAVPAVSSGTGGDGGGNSVVSVTLLFLCSVSSCHRTFAVDSLENTTIPIW